MGEVLRPLIEAAKAGKHLFCEKPMALSYDQAKEMYEVAEANSVTHYLNHNYRRCPAVQLAKQLIDDGKVGRIFHWRGAYLQSFSGGITHGLLSQTDRK